MNQLIPLNETGLHALIVQSCTGDFEITCNTMLWYNKYDVNYHNCNWPEIETLPEGKWEIIGELSHKKFTFHKEPTYREVDDLQLRKWCEEKEIFWVNPMEKPTFENYISRKGGFTGALAEYNRLQSKCLSENEKVLIINKVQ